MCYCLKRIVSVQIIVLADGNISLGFILHSNVICSLALWCIKLWRSCHMFHVGAFQDFVKIRNDNHQPCFEYVSFCLSLHWRLQLRTQCPTGTTALSKYDIFVSITYSKFDLYLEEVRQPNQNGIVSYVFIKSTNKE